jgi:hypothetical protein
VNRRTGHRAIGAEHTAIARFWPQLRAAPTAFVKELAGIGRYAFRFCRAAMRASRLQHIRANLADLEKLERLLARTVADVRARQRQIVRFENTILRRRSGVLGSRPRQWNGRPIHHCASRLNWRRRGQESGHRLICWRLNNRRTWNGACEDHCGILTLFFHDADFEKREYDSQRYQRGYKAE